MDLLPYTVLPIGFYNQGAVITDRFPIKNGLKQGDALSPLLFNFL
jgi:hypothetical protein